MDEDDIGKSVRETFGVPEPRVDWALSLGAAIMRVLDRRTPGFRDAVQEDLRERAKRMRDGADAERAALAPDIEALAESWVFTS